MVMADSPFAAPILSALSGVPLDFITDKREAQSEAYTCGSLCADQPCRTVLGLRAEFLCL